MLANQSNSVRSLLALASAMWIVGSCSGSGSPSNGAQGLGGSTVKTGGGGSMGGGSAGASASGGSMSDGGGGGTHPASGAGGLAGGDAGTGGSTLSGSAGTGGAVVTGGGGIAGTAGSGGTGPGKTGGSSGAGGTSVGTGGSGSSALTFDADRVVVTGVRSTTTPPATSMITLHNGGQTSVQITGLSLGQTDQLILGPSGMPVQTTSTPVAGSSLFQIASPPSFPMTLGAGADLAVTVQLVTTGSNLPAPPSDKNLGSTLLSTTLTATIGSASATTTVYGLLLIQDNYEPTLGQILITLGYKLNVGQAQNNWNPNTSMMAVDLPGIEAGTDEVAAPHFVKVGTGLVTMTVAARFSPVGVLPYGWYPSSTTSTMNTVGTMSMISDAQTSNKARMVYPPLQAGSSTTFDPGSGPFGLWIYSDQKTEKYNEGGNTINGDYDYTQDAPNSPAGVHRIKSYPLKDSTGAALPHQYLVAVEEAGNGDYQDYVFVLGNVEASP